MKTSFLALFLAGAALAIIPSQIVLADDDSTTSSTSPSTGSTNSGDNGEQGQRAERFKQVLAQLDLTDAQKAQIKQIFTTVTDRKERRQQIVAVLTPDQKAKLREIIQERRSETQSGGGAALAPDAN